MGFFKYDEKTGREWIEIELNRDPPYSRAAIQDYARCMNVEPENWVLDGLVWWMHECDRQGAHGGRAAPTRVYAPKPRWRVKLSEMLYGWADRISGMDDS